MPLATYMGLRLELGAAFGAAGSEMVLFVPESAFSAGDLTAMVWAAWLTLFTSSSAPLQIRQVL